MDESSHLQSNLTLAHRWRCYRVQKEAPQKRIEETLAIFQGLLGHRDAGAQVQRQVCDVVRNRPRHRMVRNVQNLGWTRLRIAWRLGELAIDIHQIEVNCSDSQRIVGDLPAAVGKPRSRPVATSGSQFHVTLRRRAKTAPGPEIQKNVPWFSCLLRRERQFAAARPATSTAAMPRDTRMETVEDHMRHNSTN